MSNATYSRRSFLRHSALGLAGLYAAADAKAHAAQKPNLIFVFSDQHSWDMLGCYGNKDIKTPRLDAYAKEGVRFDHCIANSPVCTPFRGILMSGLHPLHCGSMENDVQILQGNGKYLGEVIRDAGYRMGYYGKWHLYGGDRVRPVPPGPFRYGFDHEFLTNNCTLAFSAENAYYWDENGERTLYGDWEPYAQTRQAMQFVDAHHEEPFALFLSWHPPHNWGRAHAGYDAPQDCLDLYDPEKLTLRPTVEDTPENRMKYQGHMAMISSLDRAFGWLMDKLDEHGLKENTLVIFTSDHGDMLMSYGWPNHKGRAEHGSSRVPMLMRWPERLKPGVNETLLGTFELMPTLLGMLDLPIPEQCQGQDVSDAIFEGRNAGITEQPLFFLPGNWRGTYTPRYTYSFSIVPENDADMSRKFSYDILYDREKDPWETNNLFNDPAHQDVRRDLHEKTLAWMKRYGDPALPYGEVRRLSLREDDLADMATPPAQRPKGWEARLKGRPVDYLPEPDLSHLEL